MASDVAAAPSPLGRALGMTEEEIELLGSVFVDTLGRSGVAAGPIFERLKSGASLGEAMAIPKGVAALLYARAHRWFSAGRPDRAESLFRVLCIIDGENPDNWVGWGICLRIGERWDDALRAFRTASGLNPAWSVPHFHALELHVRRGEWPAAAAALEAYDRLKGAAEPDEIADEVDRFRSAVGLHRTRRS